MARNSGGRAASQTAKAYVPTPDSVVDLIIEKLFSKRAPRTSDIALDPGCGDGAFIEGILRYCKSRRLHSPLIIGVDIDSKLINKARRKFEGTPNVQLLQQDYLAKSIPADFIVGNPPYVSITGLNEDEKARYRTDFDTAIGRFDLYLLFFEKSIANLKPNGRLCLITPEKFEYVHTATPLRRIMTRMTVEELYHIDERTFAGLVTYPTIATIENRPARPNETTTARFRDGQVRLVHLPKDGTSWSGALHWADQMPDQGLTLDSICVRISAGVATGADAIFVISRRKLPERLRRFTYPTISGRKLSPPEAAEIRETEDVMLVPYDKQGNLLPEEKLGDLLTYLRQPENERKLRRRTCVTKASKTRRKRDWYRFHDSLPLADILRPKILCKDIAREPLFWADRRGIILPRHSVYYVVPRENVQHDKLLEYLNGAQARSWLKAHCQRAANGYHRLQSEVIRHLPVPRNILIENSTLTKASKVM